MIVNRVILASQSPRRKELLMQLGLDFEIVPATGEEIVNGDTPSEVVKNLAQMKAMEVANKLVVERSFKDGETGLVIGADTLVVNEGEILGKPENIEHARRMIRGLSGKSHSVFTGVCLVLIQENQMKVQEVFAEETKVCVYPMTEEDIENYIQSGEAMDKAGAYGIQGRFARYVGPVDGEYNTVVGLPVGRLWQEISKIQKL